MCVYIYIPVTDFLSTFLLAHDLNRKMELEEKELILSVYKSARKAKEQITNVIIDRGTFPLGAFGVPIPKGSKVAMIVEEEEEKGRW